MKLVWIQQEANSENDLAVALSLYFEGNPTIHQKPPRCLANPSLMINQIPMHSWLTEWLG